MKIYEKHTLIFQCYKMHIRENLVKSTYINDIWNFRLRLQYSLWVAWTRSTGFWGAALRDLCVIAGRFLPRLCSRRAAWRTSARERRHMCERGDSTWIPGGRSVLRRVCGTVCHWPQRARQLFAHPRWTHTASAFAREQETLAGDAEHACNSCVVLVQVVAVFAQWDAHVEQLVRALASAVGRAHFGARISVVRLPLACCAVWSRHNTCLRVTHIVSRVAGSLVTRSGSTGRLVALACSVVELLCFSVNKTLCIALSTSL